MALKENQELDLTLFKGFGRRNDREVVIWNFPRGGRTAKMIGKFFGRDAYLIEQASFILAFLPYLLIGRPEIVYFSDGNSGNILWHIRRFFGLKYKLLFSNGGPLSPPFPRWDFVQQVAPIHAERALSAGHPSEKQMVLPYGFKFNSAQPLSKERVQELRIQLSLPVDRPLVLSVAALNFSHKRLDYVVSEMTKISESRPFLILLGQADEETPELKKHAQESLGQNNFLIRSVSSKNVSSYLQAADIFVLASLAEGFPRVVGEAAGVGLPCVVHDYPLMHYILGDFGFFIDATKAGDLSKMVLSLLNSPPSDEKRDQIRKAAMERFSWDSLVPDYVKMFQACLK